LARAIGARRRRAPPQAYLVGRRFRTHRRPVLLTAYKVARLAADGNAKTRTQLAKAIDF